MRTPWALPTSSVRPARCTGQRVKIFRSGLVIVARLQPSPMSSSTSAEQLALHLSHLTLIVIHCLDHLINGHYGRKGTPVSASIFRNTLSILSAYILPSRGLRSSRNFFANSILFLRPSLRKPGIGSAISEGVRDLPRAR